ncbi:MFS transporter [Paludifilum halophilum]|uniref:MFS transporter n=1 Tax=Paludifilum halophilum TaxID=1642702 RepID=A0A235B5Z5_9BACL|nr:MFS transporter [Paludifilum halophilum]
MNRSNRITRVTFSAFFFLIFSGLGGFFPLLSVYFREEVQLNGTQIGMIMSLGPVVMMLVQPIWGMICDYTRRSNRVLTLAVGATGTLGLGYLLLDEYAWMLILAVVLAAFQAAIIPISDSIAMSYVHREGGDYGNLRLWGAVGFAVAAYCMGELSEAAGLTVIFYGFAGAMWLSVGVGLKLPREEVALNVDLRSGLRRLMRRPQFLLFLVTTFLVFGPVQANNFYFGLLIQDLGGSLAGVGLGFLLAAGTEAPFMKWAGGWIRRRGLIPVLLLAAVVSGSRWLFYAMEPSVVWVYISTVAQGLSVGLFIPAALQYVKEVAPREVQTTAIALYTAVGTGLGNWFFTLVGGFVIDGFHIFTAYLLYGILSLIGAAILLWIRRLDVRKNPVPGQTGPSA